MNPAIIAAFYLQGASTVPYGPVLDDGLRGRLEKKCESSVEEIVVCANVDRPTNQRLTKLVPPEDEEAPPRAEVNIGDVKIDLKAESGSVGGGTSPRIMLGITIPFGKKN